ncbi:MAG: hypothetical protein V1874_01310 [Spirochaetota bacterium]
MALDESKDTKDKLYNFDKVKIIIDEKTIGMIGGNSPLEIDFYKTAYNEGFTINNGAHC